MQENHTNKPHRMAGMVYLLYLLGILFGITALIGVIVNHTLISKTSGTYIRSHFIWQIISFWTLFVCAVAGIWLLPATTMIYIAGLWWIISALFGIWFLVRKQPVPFLNT